MATYQEATGGISIQASFQKFHTANPDVYLMIVKECDRALRSNKKKFSIKAIVNYIRWNIFIETKEDTLFSVRGEIKKFRINDAYISRYARMLIIDYPHLEKFIEMRDLRAI